MITCPQCGTWWEATNAPECGQCTRTRLSAAPDLIRDKHHSDSWSTVFPRPRTILPRDFINRLDAYLADMIPQGTWFYSTRYRNNVGFFAPAPPDLACGTWIAAHSTVCAGTQDGYMVVKVMSDPHVYAHDEARFRQELRAGSYTLLPYGTVGGS